MMSRASLSSKLTREGHSIMSFDIVVSLALFVGAVVLMMRFGCGAHMGHAHSRGKSAVGHADGAGGPDLGQSDSFSLASLKGVTSALPATPARASSNEARRHGC
jgi:hypothetical protein